MRDNAGRRSAPRRPGATLGREPRCRVCGSPISKGRADLYGTCSGWKCWDRYRAEQRILRRQRQEREELARLQRRERVRAFRDRVAAPMGVDRPDLFVPLPVPAKRASLVPLPPERRRAFRNYVAGLIREAAPRLPEPGHSTQDAPAAEAGDQAARVSILRAACAVCGGRCCGGGGDNAYLSVDTIGRYMGEHPTQRPEEVLEAFLSRVAQRTYRDACICQGQQGCTLPRGMRAGGCLSFECIEMLELKAEVSGPAPYHVFLAAEDDGEILRFAFLSSPGCESSFQVVPAGRDDAGF